jgi:hypothetical protein
MWTFARVELGMRKREFWTLTHRQWHALMQRHERRERRRDELAEVMIAQLIAMVANTGYREFKNVRQPSEFMPSALRAERLLTTVRKMKPAKAERRRIGLETANAVRRNLGRFWGDA